MMNNPYKSSTIKKSTITISNIPGTNKPFPTYDLTPSQEENIVHTTDRAVSMRVQNMNKKKVREENISTTIQPSPDSKRAKLLTPKVRNSTYKVYDSDGLLVAEDGHLNALLVLWKDTVLLENEAFHTDHILPVVPFSTAHWWDSNYIRGTACIIATNIKKLREKMNDVVHELANDEWWLQQITDKMKDKLGDDSELFKAERTISKYVGKVALQVFTCKSLANELKMRSANMALLVHKCVQEQITKLTFHPKRDEKTFTFCVTFGNEDDWLLDIDGIFIPADEEGENL